MHVHVPISFGPTNQQVYSSSTMDVSPHSMKEFVANCDTEVEGVWLVEETTDKYLQVAVACVIVKPKSLSIPVCILNMLDAPATLYAGSVIATMSPIEPPAEVGAVDNNTVQWRQRQGGKGGSCVALLPTSQAL